VPELRQQYGMQLIPGGLPVPALTGGTGSVLPVLIGEVFLGRVWTRINCEWTRILHDGHLPRFGLHLTPEDERHER